MHGSVAAVTALQKSDLLITLGARFDDRVTGQLSTFAPDAKVIHADIDPAEISKNRVADVPIVGDVLEVVTRPHRRRWPPTIDGRHRAATTPPGASRPAAGRPTSRSATPTPEGGETVAPQHVIERIGAISGPESVYVAGVGQHQMWAAQFVQYERPNAWLNSGGLGTMGYAVPAAMGAKVGQPERTVWAIDGDGCFQMTNQELATCVINNIPIKVAIINNSSLGMVRQWQSLFYNERYSNTDLHTSVGSRIPDFVKLADAYGCAGSPVRASGGRRRDDQGGHGDQRPPGRRRLRRPPRRHGLADGAGGREQRRDPGRPDTAPQWDREEDEAHRAAASRPPRRVPTSPREGK